MESRFFDTAVVEEGVQCVDVPYMLLALVPAEHNLQKLLRVQDGLTQTLDDFGPKRGLVLVDSVGARQADVLQVPRVLKFLWEGGLIQSGDLVYQ